jgi:hypothetical protein
MVVEPQPRPGALAGAAAGPAGRAVENSYAAAAALSNASGIGGAGNPPGGMPCGAMAGESQPAAIGDATAKRPRRMGLCSEVADDGEIWRTTPPSRADTFAARPRFSLQIARQIRLKRR